MKPTIFLYRKEFMFLPGDIYIQEYRHDDLRFYVFNNATQAVYDIFDIPHVANDGGSRYEVIKFNYTENLIANCKDFSVSNSSLSYLRPGETWTHVCHFMNKDLIIRDGTVLFDENTAHQALSTSPL